MHEWQLRNPLTIAGMNGVFTDVQDINAIGANTSLYRHRLHLHAVNLQAKVKMLIVIKPDLNRDVRLLS